jgi:hypothetical protein
MAPKDGEEAKDAEETAQDPPPQETEEQSHAHTPTVDPGPKPRLVPVAKGHPVRFRSFDESDEYEESNPPLASLLREGAELATEEKKAAQPGRLMKGSWMKGVSEDMFRPRQVSALPLSFPLSHHHRLRPSTLTSPIPHHKSVLRTR